MCNFSSAHRWTRTKKHTHTSCSNPKVLRFLPFSGLFLPFPFFCSVSNWAVSGFQVEPIWIPCGRDHCVRSWHSHPSHFQTVYIIFLPLMLQSLCHLLKHHCNFWSTTLTQTRRPWRKGRINIKIKSVVNAGSIIHNLVVENVCRICLVRDAVQLVF